MSASDKIKKVAKKTGNVIKDGAKKTGEAVAANPQAFLYVIFGVAVIGGGYYLLKNVGSGIKDAANTLGGADIQDKIDINSLKIDSKKTSISNEVAKNYASQLLEAFNWQQFTFIGSGIIYGTDNDVVQNIFERITPEDFKLIYLNFGRKHRNEFGSPPKNMGGGIQDFIGIAKERDLVYWLNEELSPTFDTSLRALVGNIVTRAGFSFKY